MEKNDFVSSIMPENKIDKVGLARRGEDFRWVGSLRSVTENNNVHHYFSPPPDAALATRMMINSEGALFCDCLGSSRLDPQETHFYFHNYEYKERGFLILLVVIF